MSSSRSHTNGENGSRLPPALRGEAAPSAKLTEKQVIEIKRRLAKGEHIQSVADRFDVQYQTVYKIAVGETWRHIEGPGAQIKRRRGSIPPKIRDKMFDLKRRKGASNAKLARASRFSESAVARAMRDAYALTAARVQRLLMTSGSNDAAKETYGLTDAEIEEMVSYAVAHKLSSRLRKELDG